MYNEDKQRGVVDRTFTPSKVAFHRDASHATVLKKSQRNVWSDCEEDFQFFLADGSGSCIEPKDFEIDLEDGKQQVVPWTLDNYLKVSNIRFPSRARLYCVKSIPVPGTSKSLIFLYCFQIEGGCHPPKKHNQIYVVMEVGLSARLMIWAGNRNVTLQIVNNLCLNSWKCYVNAVCYSLWNLT